MTSNKYQLSSYQRCQLFCSLKVTPKIFTATVIVIMTSLITACGFTQLQPEKKEKTDPMLGVWSNNTNGDLIGLEIINQTDCNLFIERLLKPRTVRACKYEPFEDVFLVFLVQENGLCGQEADFEFQFDPATISINLFVGRDPILLTKDNF